MLSIYSNQDSLLSATSTSKPTRLQPVDLQLLDKTTYSISIESGAPCLEVHAYTADGVYLTGNHKSDYTVDSSESQGGVASYLSIDTNQILSNLGLNRGSYKVVYNLFNSIIGNYEGSKLWIKEISPSRRELKLRLTSTVDETLKQQFKDFQLKWESIIGRDSFSNYLINFGSNETYEIVNLQFDSYKYELVVKLYNPLPTQYIEKTTLWISEELIDPVLDTITIVPKYEEIPVNNIAGPNFNLSEYDGFSVATDFRTWNDLLATNITTSQKIVDSYFSGSLSGIKLNVNYRVFDNYVHYSSAVERINNFKYKMELIEYYTDQAKEVAAINGGDIVQNNLQDIFTKRNTIVSNFDDFEKYLFFESTGSRLYSHVDDTYQSIISGSLPDITVNPWPKTSVIATYTWSTAYYLWSTAATAWSVGGDPDPYDYFKTQARTTSAEAIEYFANLLEIAELYDRQNLHKLQSTVPLHIQQSDQNEEYVLFVNMLGQHFDILWTYIKNLDTTRTREEHPKDGMPEDFLYHVASSMGFELLNGKSISELWKYSFGVDENGTAIQGSSSTTPSIPDSSHTKEIWRRIVNNLPYILKTKGTSRSVKALLSCFGIPSTILTIKEFGGPSSFISEPTYYPEYVHDVFHYAWEATSGTNYLFVPTQSYINNLNPTTIEFRFKTDNNYTYSANSTYLILSTSGSQLTLTKETADDNEGTLTYIVNGKSGSISNLEIFDNSWQQVALSTSGSNGAQLQVAKVLYGKSIYNYSASFVTGSGKYTAQENLYFASGSTKLNGHYQEIRIWSGSLNAATLEEHAASPSTYTYNVDRINETNGSQAAQPYNRLLQRFSLSTNIVTSSAGLYYQESHQPNSAYTGAIYLINYTDTATDFEGFEETYYTPSPSLGGNSLYTNKVRIESSSIDANKRLNTQTRVEKSSFDKFSIDSNRVGIYFSPQNGINEDIFNQLGYFEIDDYIGDPDDVYNSTYSELSTFAINYWKKYQNKNDFEAYFRALQIYDFTLFKYIKRLLPQRVDAILGLVVEPNVLERSKFILNRKPVIEDLKHDATIDMNQSYVIESNYSSIAAKIPMTSSIVVSGINEEANRYSTAIDYTIDVNRLGSTWIENRYIGKYKYVGTGSLNFAPSTYYNNSYKPIQTIITGSRISTYLMTIKDYYYSSSLSASLNLYYSSSLKYADVFVNQSLGYQNAVYNGCKLVGTAINADSPNTIDGGPVVKVTRVNPNKIVFANNQVTTIDVATTGTKKAVLNNKPIVE